MGIVVAAAAAIAWWLPSDEQLADKLKAETEKQFGVKVTIGSAHWSLLPTPIVVVNDIRTEQTPPLVIGQLSARPRLSALLHRRLALDRLDIRDATFPRSAVIALHTDASSGGGVPVEGDEPPLRHLEVRNVTWIDYGGTSVAYDGEIEFDAHWRPHLAELRQPGSSPSFKLALKREGDADRWQADIHVGGGTANGIIELKTAPAGTLQLSGNLEPRQIEIVSALAAFNRHSPIAGKVSGKTVLSSEAESPGELVRALYTRSELSVSAASMTRFDLDKAIATLGKDHAGHTPLQELRGRMDTQNTKEGMRVTYSDIKARHGKYTARGEATLYHHQIEANGTLDIVDGAIGIPFSLSGPANKPKVTVPPAFFAGAAIGTAVLPVVGTAIGARVGAAIGRLFTRAAR